MRDKQNQTAITLYAETRKVGRKGAVSKIALEVCMHRNSVRRILQGYPAKDGNTERVIEAAERVIKQYEAQEMQTYKAIMNRTSQDLHKKLGIALAG